MGQRGSAPTDEERQRRWREMYADYKLKCVPRAASPSGMPRPTSPRLHIQVSQRAGSLGGVAQSLDGRELEQRWRATDHRGRAHCPRARCQRDPRRDGAGRVRAHAAAGTAGAPRQGGQLLHDRLPQRAVHGAAARKRCRRVQPGWVHHRLDACRRVRARCTPRPRPLRNRRAACRPLVEPTTQRETRAVHVFARRWDLARTDYEAVKFPVI